MTAQDDAQDSRKSLFAQMRLQRSTVTPPVPRNLEVLPIPATDEEYVGARIPMRWLVALGHLPGKSVLLGLLLWHWATLGHRSAIVALRPGAARKAGLSRGAMYGALSSLEQARLVTVSRQRGRAAIVRILDV